MIKLFINNKPVIVKANSSVLEACESIGLTIPRFCYHERLNVAGNCRMCLVEIEKAPKPVASCAFPVSNNMRVFTDTPLVQKARENVLEFLLINHPLDCPICDQGGECDLQEQTLVFGSDRSRFRFKKRGVEDKNCGPLVKTIMTRCIHCTRCVRFLQEIAGEEDFGTTARGKTTEIGTYVEKALRSELSGNIVDLCPVGALTSKPYAFSARPWELKSIDSIDITDSIGSNIKINFKETEILRVLPVVNDNINEEWISDKTRYFFDGLKTNRINNVWNRKDGTFVKSSWKAFINMCDSIFANNLENNLFVAGNNLSLETLLKLKKISQNLGIDLISESKNAVESNLLVNSRTSVNIESILESDLIVLVGVNPRFEASLYNVRLKKCDRKGQTEIFSIGINENLTYLDTKLGNSYKTFLQIVEGKHPICKKIVSSKKPSIIFGAQTFSELKNSGYEKSLEILNRNTQVLSSDWVGISHILPSVNSFSHNLLNITNVSTLKNKTNIWLFDLEDFDKFINDNKLEKTNLLSFTSNSFQKIDMCSTILPITNFTENQGSFINTEGVCQIFEKALAGPETAINLSEFFEILAYKYKNNISAENETIINTLLEKQDVKFDFTKILLKTSIFDNRSNNQFNKKPLKGKINNFYQTSTITKNSKILAECSSLLKKRYSNF